MALFDSIEAVFDSFCEFLERSAKSTVALSKTAQDKYHQRQQANAARAVQNQALAVQKHQALLAANTGLGACPQCRSHSIREVREKAPDDNSAANAACCLGCLFFWPMMILSLFLKRRGAVTIFRQCNACGYKYRI